MVRLNLKAVEERVAPLGGRRVVRPRVHLRVAARLREARRATSRACATARSTSPTTRRPRSRRRTSSTSRRRPATRWRSSTSCGPRQRSCATAPRFVIVTDYSELLAVDTKTGENLMVPIAGHRPALHVLPALGRHGEGAVRRRGARRRQGRRADGQALRRAARREPRDPRATPSGGTPSTSSSPGCCSASSPRTPASSARTSSPTRSAATPRPTGPTSPTSSTDLFRRWTPQTPATSRSTFAEFPYVNGRLFTMAAEHTVPRFTKRARDLLIESGTLDLARDQPRHLRLDVPGDRHPRQALRSRSALHVGAEHPQDHRAAVPRRAEGRVRRRLTTRVEKLEALLERISAIKVFDPACGSGNFLVIAYKELRKLEHAILERLAEIDRQAPGAVRRVEDQHRELLRHRARRLRRRGRDPVAVDRQAPDERRVQGEVQPLDPADPAQGDRPDPSRATPHAIDWNRSVPTTASGDLPHRQPAVQRRQDADQGAEGRLRRSSSGDVRTRRTSTTSRCGSSRVPTTSKARERSSRSSPPTRSPKASTSV